MELAPLAQVQIPLPIHERANRPILDGALRCCCDNPLTRKQVHQLCTDTMRSHAIWPLELAVQKRKISQPLYLRPPGGQLEFIHISEPSGKVSSATLAQIRSHNMRKIQKHRRHAKGKSDRDVDWTLVNFGTESTVQHNKRGPFQETSDRPNGIWPNRLVVCEGCGQMQFLSCTNKVTRTLTISGSQPGNPLHKRYLDSFSGSKLQISNLMYDCIRHCESLPSLLSEDCSLTIQDLFEHVTNTNPDIYGKGNLENSVAEHSMPLASADEAACHAIVAFGGFSRFFCGQRQLSNPSDDESKRYEGLYTASESHLFEGIRLMNQRLENFRDGLSTTSIFTVAILGACSVNLFLSG